MFVARRIASTARFSTQTSMSFSTTSYTVKDVKLRESSDKRSGTFYIPLAPSAEAVLEYEMYPKAHKASDGSAKDVFVATHVIVPKEYGGKGLAQIVCEKAFDYVKDKNYMLYPQCTYVKNRYVPSLTDPILKSLVTDVFPGKSSL